MSEITWSNRIGHRNREPFAVVVAPDGTPYIYSGSSIPNVAASTKISHEKNGKWSHTTYRLTLVGGAKLVAWKESWEEGWAIPAPTWREAQEWFTREAPHADWPKVMELFREKFPNNSARLDKVDAEIEALESAAGETEEFVISFGNPTNRQIRDGWWEAPKSGIAPLSGKEVVIKPGDEGDWNKAVSLTDGSAVLSVSHSRGTHGGYYSVRVAIV